MNNPRLPTTTYTGNVVLTCRRHVEESILHCPRHLDHSELLTPAISLHPDDHTYSKQENDLMESWTSKYGYVKDPLHTSAEMCIFMSAVDSIFHTVRVKSRLVSMLQYACYCRAGANGTAATAMAVPVFSQTLTPYQNFVLICVAA